MAAISSTNATCASALKAGDLIFTGTPAGVAALQRGDSFHAALEGIATLDGRIV